MAVISFDACAALAKTCRARGQTLVVATGVFDLMHLGHTRHLAAASAEGDVLIVCVRADRSVRAERAGELITSEAERAEIVAALAGVDAVVVLDDEAIESAVERLGGRVSPAPVSSEWSTAAILAKVRRGA